MPPERIKRYRVMNKVVMNESFWAYQVVREGEGYQGQIVNLPLGGLPPGDVLIRVAFSSLNYKDALSAIGNPGVTRKYPRIPGVDVAGTVETCTAGPLRPGDKVLVTGYDLGVIANCGMVGGGLSTEEE